ncbi:MAG: hypothetical protein ACMXYG_02365 [Candidatus Woesearchaeota archaeon]
MRIDNLVGKYDRIDNQQGKQTQYPVKDATNLLDRINKETERYRISDDNRYRG